MNDKPPDTNSKQGRGLLQRLGAFLSRRQKQRDRTVNSNGHRMDLETMAGAVITLDQKQIRDIMVPRSEVVFAYEDEKPEEVIDRVISTGYTRLPVADKDEQKILGILHAKDLLQSKDEKASVQGLMRGTQMVPESMRISVLLEEFKRTRLHMAGVMDEYGGIAGIVTIEDILEQIVGAIEDEHDKQEVTPRVRQLSANSWEVRAHLPLTEFNRQFNAELSHKDADTLGGLVLAELGHMPERGETLQLGAFDIRVEEIVHGRIQLLQVQGQDAHKAAS